MSVLKASNWGEFLSRKVTFLFFFLSLFKGHTDKTDDKKFIVLIEELVNNYISKENSIIVFANYKYRRKGSEA